VSWDQARRAVERGGSNGIGRAAGHLLDASTDVAPIESGSLIDSAGTDQDRLDATVFYNEPYAIREHEDMDDRHDAGRRSKYLEQPLHAEADQMLALIADSLRREIGP